jgi:late competence protein required for DNA uptake (superfamily II DNA/RNA helicase)
MSDRQSPPRRQACIEARKAAVDILVTAALAARGITMSDIEGWVEAHEAEHREVRDTPNGNDPFLSDEIPF